MSDGLRYIGGIKAKLGKAMLAAMDRVDVEKSEVKTSMLVLLGNRDRICYPKGTQAFFEAIGSEDKESKEYPGRQFNSITAFGQFFGYHLR